MASRQVDRYYFMSKSNLSLLQQFSRGSGMRVMMENREAQAALRMMMKSPVSRPMRTAAFLSALPRAMG
jgi:hypothetical protein